MTAAPDPLRADQTKVAQAADVIATFIATAPRSHPDAVLTLARRAFVDTFGCMHLGANHPETLTVLQTVHNWGNGTSRVFGHTKKLAAPWAALVNGTAAHAYDFDDWEDPGITHASAALLPSILAIADETAPLDTILDAWVIGIEVIMRIGEAVNMTHYELGWHTTNTLGAIGAAAACARLIGLNSDMARNAIALSTSMMGGFTSQFGTTAKPMHAGLAAKSGVISSALASNGATGQPGVFEKNAGFLNVMTKASPQDLAKAVEKLGKAYAMLEYGLHIKKFPSCGGTHLIIEACQIIRSNYDLATTNIERVETSISDIAFSILPYGIPKNRTEALFSVPWCAAFALLNDSVGVSSFELNALTRKDVHALASRVSVIQHSRSPGLAHHPSFPDVVTVYLTDGQNLSHSIAYPIGSPTRPLSNSELKRKFLDCMEKGNKLRAQGSKVFEIVMNCSQQASISELTKM
jgi:2-methylcitrate dehydratase PrpD